MLRRPVLALVAAAIAAPAIAQTTGDATMTLSQKGFAPINGLELYYEVHGSGAPLVMLHGGKAATEMLGPNLELLAKTRQVIVPHMQPSMLSPFCPLTMNSSLRLIEENMQRLDQASFDMGDIGAGDGGGPARQTGTPLQATDAVVAECRPDRREAKIRWQASQKLGNSLANRLVPLCRTMRLMELRTFPIETANGLHPPGRITLAED